VKKSVARRAMTRFGLRVLEEREAQGMTQEKFAERIGLSPRQVQRIEAGVANISLEKVFELAHALAVDAESLFGAPSASTIRREGRPPRREV
jgi:transcriptional regulator with XRE-family HTH domain